LYKKNEKDIDTILLNRYNIKQEKLPYKKLT